MFDPAGLLLCAPDVKNTRELPFVFAVFNNVKLKNVYNVLIVFVFGILSYEALCGTMPVTDKYFEMTFHRM